MDSTHTLESLVGCHIAHAWLSHSALYLELAPLSPGRDLKNGGRGNPRGQMSIFAGYEWRVERPMSILGGSSSNPRSRHSVIAKLIGQTIESVQSVGQVPELKVHFSSGLALVTFATDTGQPDWGVHFNVEPGGYLSVKRGKVKFVGKPA